MIHYDCEMVGDLLPAFVRGELLPQEAASAEQHLDICATCREEAALVRMLQDTLVPVPDLLEARVVAAVRRRSTRRWQPARLAMAATIAATVLGGAAVFDRTFRSEHPELALDTHSVTWAAAEDPLLHGTSDLQQLSVEELEVLLAELEQ